MLDGVEKAPARLIGVGVYNLSANEFRQLTLDELVEGSVHARETEMKRRLADGRTRKNNPSHAFSSHPL